MDRPAGFSPLWEPKALFAGRPQRCGHNRDTAVGITMAAALAISSSALLDTNAGAVTFVARTAEPSVNGETGSGKFEPPFPFDAEELWEKLAQVTALHGRLLAPALIENIFHVQLKEFPDNPSNSVRLFGVRAHIDWYYGMGVHIYRDETLFTFGWGQTSGSRYTAVPQEAGNFCITRDMVSNTLKEQGWEIRSSAPPYRSTDDSSYNFGKAELRVIFSRQTGCLDNLLVRSNPAR